MAEGMSEGGSRSGLWLLLRHELRSILRDQKTVLMSVVLPLVLMPAILLLLTTLDASARGAEPVAATVESTMATRARE